MTPPDFEVLCDRINAIATVFDRKPLTPQAVAVWYDTLKDFPAHHVMDCLIAWPRGHSKMPTPMDVWKDVSERGTRERSARSLRTEHAQGGLTQDAETRARIRKIIADTRAKLALPSPHPRAWAQKILDRHREGQPVSSYALRCALEVAGDLRGPLPEREPGCDDDMVPAGYP